MNKDIRLPLTISIRVMTCRLYKSCELWPLRVLRAEPMAAQAIIEGGVNMKLQSGDREEQIFGKLPWQYHKITL